MREDKLWLIMSSRFYLIKSNVVKSPFVKEELLSFWQSEISWSESNFKKSKYGTILLSAAKHSFIFKQMSDVVKFSIKSSYVKKFFNSKWYES